MSAWLTLKQHCHRRSLYVRYALRMSIACSIGVGLYTLFPMQNGYWVAFSVIACVWPTQGMSILRIKQRFWGTFLGIGLSLLLAHFIHAHGWWVHVLLPCCIFLMFYFKTVNYALYVFFATLVTLLFVCLLNPGNPSMALTRLELTALGILIALVCSLCIFPVRQGQQLPCHISQVKQSLRQYFAVLCDYYEHRAQASMASVQGQTFKYLQIAQSALQESRLEWSKARPHASQAREMHRLTTVYEKLLCLHIHMPEDFSREDLRILKPDLAMAMRAMLPLFDMPDEVVVFHVNRQLVELQTAIKSRRSKAANDPKLKAAVLYDYMQWTLFIDTLQNLLVFLPHKASKGVPGCE